MDTVVESSKKLGSKSRKIFNSSGHDTQLVADMLPSAMIFVPGIGGYSHCEKEFTFPEQCAKSVDVFLNNVLKPDKSLNA